jgi:hypothetical protein
MPDVCMQACWGARLPAPHLVDLGQQRPLHDAHVRRRAAAELAVGPEDVGAAGRRRRVAGRRALLVAGVVPHLRARAVRRGRARPHYPTLALLGLLHGSPSVL